MEQEALSQNSTQVMDRSMTPHEHAERVREELEGHGEMWTRLGADADLKTTIIAAAAKATVDHLCPQKRARRRMSVLEKTDIVLHKVNSSIAELNDLWDKIDMDEQRRLTRVSTAYEHVVKLMDDMVSSEHAMVVAIEAQIGEYTAKVEEIRKELGLEPFKAAAYPEGSIALWKALEADVQQLDEERATLIEEQKAVVDRFAHLISRLGDDLGDDTAASLPDYSVLAPRSTVADLRDRCVKMEQLLGQRIDKVVAVQAELLKWIGRMKCDYSEDVAAALEVDARCAESALTATFVDYQLDEIRATMADAYAEWLSGRDAEYKELIVRLHELWEMCCVDEHDRRLPSEFDPALLDSLEEARAEVERLEAIYETGRDVYEKMGAWKTHWAEKLQFENSESSLDKYTNRGGALDQRIKYENRLNKQLLPHAVHAVSEAYAAFLKDHPEERVYIDGMEPLAYIRHVTSTHDLEKEMEREQKVQAKKAQLLQETKWGSTPAPKQGVLGRRPLTATASASRLAPSAKVARVASGSSGNDDGPAAAANFTFDQSTISAISPKRKADVLFPKTSSPKGSRATVAPGMRFNNTPSKSTPATNTRTPTRQVKPFTPSNKK